MSAEDAAARNAEIDRAFVEYEQFLDAGWPAALNALARTLPFKLVLENDGSAPADDVDVQIWTDARGRWLEELPSLPAIPAPPRLRSIYDSILEPRIPYEPDLNNRSIHDNVDGPNIGNGDRDRRVQYGVKRVKHHVPCELPVVYFQFDSDADVRSFSMSVKLVAANIRRPGTGTLNVEIARGSPAPPFVPGAADGDADESSLFQRGS